MKKLGLLTVVLLGVALLAAPMMAQAAINEGFEDAYPPTGWYEIGTDTSSYANTGNVSIRFQAAGDLLVTPLVASPGTMTFYLRSSAAVDSLSNFIVEYSDDGQVTWNALAGSPIVAAQDNTFVVQTFDLSSYSNIYVRFRRGDTKYYYVDDVSITDRSGGTQDPNGTERASITVSPIQIDPIVSLTVQDENLDGALNFGSISAVYEKADESIMVTAQSNYGSWAVEIYTDNYSLISETDGSVDVSKWGYQRGGLVDTANTQKIALGWVVFDASQKTIGDAEGAAKPGESRWNYIKDKCDIDDPNTTSDDSWAGREGYAKIAFGSMDSVNFINPYIPSTYSEPVTQWPLYVYVETASMAPVGSYAGTIHFDLIHE